MKFLVYATAYMQGNNMEFSDDILQTAQLAGCAAAVVISTIRVWMVTICFTWEWIEMKQFTNNPAILSQLMHGKKKGVEPKSIQQDKQIRKPHELKFMMF